MQIAWNILNDRFDAEECVNDAYLAVWNTIPPQKPDPLLAYVCRIVHNLSMKKYHANNARKRNSHYDVALDEIEECIQSKATVEYKYKAEVPFSAKKGHFLQDIGNKKKNLNIGLMCILAIVVIICVFTLPIRHHITKKIRDLTYVKYTDIINHEEVDTDESDLEGKTRHDLSIVVKGTPFFWYCRIVLEILL
jgi:hypothetical protein